MKITGSKFLLVEDEPIIGFALEDMMIDAGAETRFASTLEEGLQIAAQERFDGAIVDMNLHGVDSYPLARELLRAKVAVVFATGYGDRTRPEEFAEVIVLPKPYDMNGIRRAFESLS